MPSTRDPSLSVFPGPGRLPAFTVPASALIFPPGGGGSSAALEAHITDPIDAHMLTAIGQLGYTPSAYAGSTWSVPAGTSDAAVVKLLAASNARPVWVLDASADPLTEADFTGTLALDNAYASATYGNLRPILYLRPGTYTWNGPDTTFTNMTLIGASQSLVTLDFSVYQMGVSSNTHIENVTITKSNAIDFDFNPGSYNVMRNVTLDLPGDINFDNSHYALLENVSTVTSLAADALNVTIDPASSHITFRNYKNCQIEVLGDNCTIEHGQVTAVRDLDVSVVFVGGDLNTIHDIQVTGLTNYNATGFHINGNQNQVTSIAISGTVTPNAGFVALRTLGTNNSVDNLKISTTGVLPTTGFLLLVDGARTSLSNVVIDGLTSAVATTNPVVWFLGTELRINGLTFLSMGGIGVLLKINRPLMKITTGFGEFNSVYVNELSSGTTLNLSRVLDVTALGLLGPLSFKDWSVYSATGNDQVAYLSTIGNPVNPISFTDCLFAGAGDASYVLTMDQCFFVTMTNVAVVANSGKAALLTSVQAELSGCSVTGGISSAGAGNQLFGGFAAYGLNLVIRDTLFSLGSSNHSPAAKTFPSIFFGGAGLTPGGTSVGTGAVANITVFGGGVSTLTGLTGMTANSVGNSLVVTGAAAAGNNGTFEIVSYISPTSVTIANPLGSAPDGNNGSISWNELYGHGSTTLSNCIVSCTGGTLNLTSIVAFHLTGTVSNSRLKDSIQGLTISTGDLSWDTTGSGQGVFGSFAGDSHPAVLEIFGDSTTTAVFDGVRITGVQNTVALTDARHIVKAQNCTINNLLVDGPTAALAGSGSFSSSGVVALSNVRAEGMDIFPTAGVRVAINFLYVKASSASVLRNGKIQNLVTGSANALYLDASKASDFVITNTQAGVTVNGAMVALVNSTLANSQIGTAATTGDSLVYLSTSDCTVDGCTLDRTLTSAINYITANVTGIARGSIRNNRVTGIGGTGTLVTLTDVTDFDVSENKISVNSFTTVFSLTGTSTRNTLSNNHIAPILTTAYQEFNIAANGNTVTGNAIAIAGSNAATVSITGDSNQFTNNHFDGLAGDPEITISGTLNTVSDNRLVCTTGTPSITTSANKNRVESNTLVGDTPALDISFALQQVMNNRLLPLGGIGSLNVAGGSCTISGNTLEAPSLLETQTSAVRTLISNNQVRNGTLIGIQVRGDDSMVVGNIVLGDIRIESTSDGVVVASNSLSAGDDIIVAGTNVTVMGNSMDGGDIDATGSTGVAILGNVNVGVITDGTTTLKDTGDEAGAYNLV